MNIFVNAIKIIVVLILLVCVGVGGLCVMVSGRDVEAGMVGIGIMLLFGLPAWMLVRSMLRNDESESKEEPPVGPPSDDR